ncbi:MAG: SDR family oxidoreductase [Dehalococcoidia bacterium]
MDTSYLTLQGKVALVTGGSRGIGKAIALQFADAGADVIVSSRKLPDLEKAADEIRAMGRRSLAVSAHNGKMDDLKNLMSRVKDEFGRIDILVNNTGVNPAISDVLHMEEAVYDRILDVNLKSHYFLSQAAARMMVEQGKGGNIINIASAAGVAFTPGFGPYSMSKAGLIMMTRVLACELGPYNIRVNCIAPGFVKTKFSEAVWSNEVFIQEAMKRMAIKKLCTPEEIARTALYFASEASSFTTGMTLVIDGGVTL